MSDHLFFVCVDGRVFCERLCVSWSGGKLIFTKRRAEMGQQERQARHEVPGTLLHTEWKNLLSSLGCRWCFEENLLRGSVLFSEGSTGNA